MTAVFKRRRELRRAVRLARVLVALDDAAGASRRKPYLRATRASLGSHRA